ncbi:MAG: T9SS type A sorting domain-containing protein [Flavobacteriales bacterium]|nr:T9SS type A sorting domain-containing protein [Flavobacteriales bacterium]
MKHLYLSIALLAATGMRAQTTALDFTANDCAGASHTLFSDLDAGYCVVIDLVMMGCPSCIPATHAIVDDVIPNTSNPAMVKFYSIGFSNSVTCAQITSWATTNGFTHPVFGGMSAQTTYYGGMGMPTVIVLGGGATHGVYYNELGHSASDNPTIISAINTALLDANGVEENSARSITLGPNPVGSVLNLNGSYTSAKVIDMHGRVVLNNIPNGTSLDVSTLASGQYTLELIAADKSHAVGRFMKQ